MLFVADQIGPFGFEAGLLEYFSDARERFLKPNGVMIPSRLELYVAPVECPELSDQVEFWNDSPAGFDFRPVRSLAVNTGYPAKFGPDHLLGGPALLGSLDLSMATLPSLHRRLASPRHGRAPFTGLAGGFRHSSRTASACPIRRSRRTQLIGGTSFCQLSALPSWERAIMSGS